MPLDTQAPEPVLRQDFDIRPLHAPLGAEVLGLDLSRPLATADLARIHRAHLEHHVLVFRDARITPAQQVAFSRRFGEPQVHVLRQFQLRKQPEVLVVSNIRENGEPIGLGDAGHLWHSDLSYKAVPSLGSMLHAQELPQEGGDTLFANQHLAWDTLPASLKREVRHAQAEHSYLARYEELRRLNRWRPALTQAQIDEVVPVRHPVVRIHPETGRRALFVSEHFTTRIVDIPEARSRELLARLFEHGTRPEFIYRHRWQPHDMVFWDNRSLLHLASKCPPDQRRKLYRTTIAGDVPF